MESMADHEESWPRLVTLEEYSLTIFRAAPTKSIYKDFLIYLHKQKFRLICKVFYIIIYDFFFNKITFSVKI